MCVLREKSTRPQGSLVAGSRETMFTATGEKSAGDLWPVASNGARSAIVRPVVACRRRDCREIARQHLGCRHEREEGAWGHVHALYLAGPRSRTASPRRIGPPTVPPN